jgi:heme/copper-type cytochrome/quinol oxidase subunit 1
VIPAFGIVNELLSKYNIIVIFAREAMIYAYASIALLGAIV